MGLKRADYKPTCYEIREGASVRRLYNFLASRPYSVIVFGALFCTIAVKLFSKISNLERHRMLGIKARSRSVLAVVENSSGVSLRT